MDGMVKDGSDSEGDCEEDDDDEDEDEEEGGRKCVRLLMSHLCKFLSNISF